MDRIPDGLWIVRAATLADTCSTAHTDSHSRHAPATRHRHIAAHADSHPGAKCQPRVDREFRRPAAGCDQKGKNEECIIPDAKRGIYLECTNHYAESYVACAFVNAGGYLPGKTYRALE